MNNSVLVTYKMTKRDVLIVMERGDLKVSTFYPQSILFFHANLSNDFAIMAKYAWVATKRAK